MKPPPLKNDCFALPPGVEWTPVDQAHALLRDRLSPVTAAETVALDRAAGRYLAANIHARRAHPPAPNSAVDGYGFRGGAVGEGVQILPLVVGRAAAGAPLPEVVPDGHAARVLTGAILPEGVDTVVLQEDVTAEPGRIAFHGPVKPGANTRAAGEDVAAGQTILTAGRQLTPADIGLLAAVGIAEVPVRRQLRVGVLSTGDEIVSPGAGARPHQVYDANRPMLLGQLRAWGYDAVDLGHVPDDRAALRACLDGADVQAILTSGGASAGEEDHVSALLQDTGTMALWRIAIKPGRPLALGLWNGTPVFGLPGNPVAALVCTLVFAAPALRVLAGGLWSLPRPVRVPAAFSKRKKPGRREYLRARLNDDGCAEVFASEGSGRVSGLSWADGLVELGEEAAEIRSGDPVRYLAFASF